MTLPRRFWIGSLLLSTAWSLNWGLSGLRSHWAFFPLWLGYILVVDALAERRNGSSPYSRSRSGFSLLFVISAPAWWLYELLNLRTQNWEYLGRDSFSQIEYALLASLSFSTVIPALLCTRDLLGANSFDRFRRGPILADSVRLRWTLFAMGVVMLAALLAMPRFFYPFLWGSIYCLLEPFNLMRGHRSLIDSTSRGDWTPVVRWGLAALICGFFWEMWNLYSYPKWIYHVPYVGFAKIFEMPALGYLGYIPFAWEIQTLLFLVVGRGRGSPLDCAIGPE